MLTFESQEDRQRGHGGSGALRLSDADYFSPLAKGVEVGVIDISMKDLRYVVNPEQTGTVFKRIEGTSKKIKIDLFFMKKKLKRISVAISTDRDRDRAVEAV